MTLAEVRNELRQARERLEAGDTATAIGQIDRVLQELGERRLLTPAQAAEFLGIQSEFIVKLWCGRGFLTCVNDGDCVMVPLSEIERVRDSREVEAMRISDRLHDLSAEFGEPDGLTEQELEDSEASRPGRLPWQKPRND